MQAEQTAPKDQPASSSALFLARGFLKRANEGKKPMSHGPSASRGASLLVKGQNFRRRHDTKNVVKAVDTAQPGDVPRDENIDMPSWGLRAPFAAVPSTPTAMALPMCIPAIGTSEDCFSDRPGQSPSLPKLTPLAWGWGGEGRLGTGREAEEDSPCRLHPVLRGRQLVAVAAGARHTLFLARDGRMLSVGDNSHWQLGATSDWGKGRVIDADGAPPPSRRVPSRVLPSGHRNRRGCDYAIAAVAAGIATSYGRERTGAEAAAAVEGLTWMTAGAMALLAAAPDSLHLRRLAAHVSEESAMLWRRHRGRVVAWGSGRAGELGLGAHLGTALTPRLVRGLADRCVVAGLAAGGKHVLCTTAEGRIFAWGCGRDGRLGLGDFASRWEPALVEALAGHVVTLVAAGHAHSLAAVAAGPEAAVWVWGRGAHGRLGCGDLKNRTLPTRLMQWPPGVYIGDGSGGGGSCGNSGQGAGNAGGSDDDGGGSVFTHGGGGGNSGADGRNHKAASAGHETDGAVTVAGAALGGAHTLLLLLRPVQRCMRHPHGRVSTVLAWGCGTGGQLGVGAAVAALALPTRVPVPRHHVVTSLAAGKAHSLAVTASGELLAWGKGWLGELGHSQARDFRVAPAAVVYPGSDRHLFVAAAAGDRHSVALALETRPPHSWAQYRRHEELAAAGLGDCGGGSGGGRGGGGGSSKSGGNSSGGGNLLRPLPTEATLMATWRCPRRPPHADAGSSMEPLYACRTCEMDCVCRVCARLCHRGHKLAICSVLRRVLCQCGMTPLVSSGGGGGFSGTDKESRTQSNFCKGGNSNRRRKWAGASGHLSGSGVFGGCRLPLAPTEESEHVWGSGGLRQRHAAAVVRRAWRAFAARQDARNARTAAAARITAAATQAWSGIIVGAVEAKIKRATADTTRWRERADMAAADAESAFYRYYRTLQPVLRALAIQQGAVRAITMRGAVALTAIVPVPPQSPAAEPAAAALLLRRTAAIVGSARSSFSMSAPAPRVMLWTRRAVRQALRVVPPLERPTPRHVTLATALLPPGTGARPWAGEVPDPDVNLLAAAAADAAAATAAAADRSVAATAAAVTGQTMRRLPRREAATLAAPEGLYERVRLSAAAAERASWARRRLSIAEGMLPHVDKETSPYDRRWRAQLCVVWRGVDASLSATRCLQIGNRRLARLTAQRHLPGRRGAWRYGRFLGGFVPGSSDPDAAVILAKKHGGGGNGDGGGTCFGGGRSSGDVSRNKEPAGRTRPDSCTSSGSGRQRGRPGRGMPAHVGRSHSLCAPERASAALITWQQRVEDFAAVLAAGAAAGYPASDDAPGVAWTRRLRWALAGLSSDGGAGNGGSDQPGKAGAAGQDPDAAAAGILLRVAAAEAFACDSLRIAARAAAAKIKLDSPDTASKAAAAVASVAAADGNSAGGPTDGGGSWLTAAVVLSLPWTQLDDGSGNFYYYNGETGESTWTPPPYSP